jgi:integrase
MVDGREVRKSAGRSKQAAQQLLAQLRADAERGKVGLARKSTATLKAWTPKYLDWAGRHKRSADRDARSLKMLVARLGNLRLSDIGRVHVEAYQRDRAGEGVTGATCNREVACLRKLLSHAVEAGQLESNPLVGVKGLMMPEAAPRQPVLSLGQEKALLAAAPAWARPILRAAVMTGCRAGELLALRWRHVDFDGREVVVEDSKSGDSRRVPLHPEAMNMLRPFRGLPEAPVFMMPDGSPVLITSLSRAFKNAAREIGRGDLRLHDLRHVCGTRLLAQSANLPEVAALLGHKTLAMARRYAHVTRTRLHDLVASVPATADKAGKGEA